MALPLPLTLTLREDDAEFEVASNPWYDPSGDDSQSLTVNLDEPGKMSIAITKTDQMPSSGFGDIGTFSFVIIEDVVEAIPVDTIFQPDSIILINDKMDVLPVTLDTSKLTALKYLNQSLDINVFPNPNKGLFHISSAEAVITEIRIMDIFGKMMKQHKSDLSLKTITLNNNELPNGFYTLEIHTSKGITIRKIIIQRE